MKDLYRLWSIALLRGAEVGMYGDFLMNAIRAVGDGRPGDATGELLKGLAGPTIGPLIDLGVVNPLEAISNTIQGKEGHFLAKQARTLKGFVPGGNIWYTKAALDHLVWHHVMESLSPGYLATVRLKSLENDRQQWWWQPGKLTPDRGPELGQAVR